MVTFIERGTFEIDASPHRDLDHGDSTSIGFLHWYWLSPVISQLVRMLAEA